MTFKLVDELLSGQMTGAARAPAAEQLDMRLVRFARGVAVYEMPVRGEICDAAGTVGNGVLTALAEAAMTAAAITTVPDDLGEPAVLTRELCARFDHPVIADGAGTLRAEAIVVRAGDGAVEVEAVILCDRTPVATFEATCGQRLPRLQMQAA